MNLTGALIALFVAGFVENFVNGWYTKAVAHGHRFGTFASATLYVVIWYVALRVIVENLTNIWIAFSYAIGSGIGSLGLVMLYQHRRKQRRQKRNARCAHQSDTTSRASQSTPPSA